MPFPFYCAKNLVEQTMTLGEPWAFGVEDEHNWLKKLPKSKRKKEMLDPRTSWNVYTAVRGRAANLRVSESNPAQEVTALVVDYDMVASIDEVCKYLDTLRPGLRPAWIEISLGGKIRLVWIFERTVLTPSNEFCQEFLKTLVNELGASTLLAGYDANSVKPTELWTNGGTWLALWDEDKGEVMPLLSWTYLFGVLCKVSQKASLFANSEISLDVIADEVQKRYPNRWHGDFKLDATGVRFWDEKADNPTGCQVKPDGMLCFTGKVPFQKWEQIFGREWCEEKKVLNLGQAGKNLLFDGKNYWEPSAHSDKKFETIIRADAMLHLQASGLSNKTPKGVTISDAERVLRHVQVANRIVGAAPLVNHPPGLVTIENNRVLNIADLHPVQPVKGEFGTEEDFKWLWEFLCGLFPGDDMVPLHHFLAWLQRSYRAILTHIPYMGQAIFLCGPKNNGKTLLCLQVIKPLLGNKTANPVGFMQGNTDFNSELFASYLLAVNDEESPSNDAARRRMMAKLKGMVVNPSHKYHAKFEKPVTVYWTGRIVTTLNNDSGSVGMLPEVEDNTSDKMMFFASQPYKGVFPPQQELEAELARTLPAFAWWLLNVYVPPAEVLSDDRMGVKSYYDQTIVELARQQTYASNLEELIEEWQKADAFWQEPGNTVWEGTPTGLLSCFQTCAETAGTANEWTQQKMAKSLSSLSRLEGTGVTYTGEAGRLYQITRKNIVDKTTKTK